MTTLTPRLLSLRSSSARRGGPASLAPPEPMLPALRIRRTTCRSVPLADHAVRRNGCGCARTPRVRAARRREGWALGTLRDYLQRWLCAQHYLQRWLCAQRRYRTTGSRRPRLLGGRRFRYDRHASLDQLSPERHRHKSGVLGG